MLTMAGSLEPAPFLVVPTSVAVVPTTIIVIPATRVIVTTIVMFVEVYGLVVVDMLMYRRRYTVTPANRMVAVSVVVLIIVMVPLVAAQMVMLCALMAMVPSVTAGMVVYCALTAIVSLAILDRHTELLEVLSHNSGGR